MTPRLTPWQARLKERKDTPHGNQESGATKAKPVASALKTVATGTLIKVKIDIYKIKKMKKYLLGETASSNRPQQRGRGSGRGWRGTRGSRGGHAAGQQRAAWTQEEKMKTQALLEEIKEKLK